MKKQITTALLIVGVLAIGCRDRPKEEAKQSADTLSVRARTTSADTVPEMPEGFKSIHQLELEAHRDTTDTSAQEPRPH